MLPGGKLSPPGSASSQAAAVAAAGSLPTSAQTTPKRTYASLGKVHGIDAHDWMDMMRTSSL